MHYHKPHTFEDAIKIAASARGVTRFLAGGTDVLVQLRAGTVTPDDLIDLKLIPGVHDIVRAKDGGWTIGIAVSGAELGRHAALVADWPGVVEGMNLVGSTQVQGRATLAGNLCNGSPAADSVPGMIAAGAKVAVTGPNGSREIPVEQIPAGPGRINLTKGELIRYFRNWPSRLACENFRSAKLTKILNLRLSSTVTAIPVVPTFVRRMSPCSG